MKTSRYWVAAMALLLTGCTSVVTGAASVDQGELRQYQDDHAPLTAQRALGDLTTVDYCSLLDLNGARQADATGVGSTTTSPNYCFAEGNFGGTRVEFGLGYLEVAGTDSGRITDLAKTLPRGLVAQRSTSGDPDSCVRYLRFADEFSLQVYVDEQLGGQGRKSPTIPTKHRCRWQNTVTPDVLTITFDVGPQPTGPTEALAGRQTSIEGGAGLTYCVATTAVGPDPGSTNGNYRLAQVYTLLRRGGTDPCVPVRALANIVWPKLPAA
ncbi:hypothetical protein LWP59_06780 [Amycolatopsis acidiphila]|uniref:DUF3558 domain-containing protein n=1 Tax=Amycolatopsis acidiphila TaxID=715473 RepID=A0A558A9S2_9PSEU|nr:hypothetical protein [Amycolatopsis acidiphila]TVT21010.1 hypothetical protein FNH06_18455 [Amycolatopsis acidiphila]UIJ61329.1 hypothetical protein LWP59_06780 [Amycolatopsis acidiphila]GHG78187.1 hypothetical protein GCM10017788_45100 [Amycolatopsis acidiphila]